VKFTAAAATAAFTVADPDDHAVNIASTSRLIYFTFIF